MLCLKRLVRSSGAAIALAAACLSTSAHAGWDAPFGWGVGGPTNNGFRGPIDNGPRAGAVGTFRGVGSRQNFGINPYYGWGMSAEHNVGLGPFGSFFGIGPGQALGLNMPNALGINPQYSFGFREPLGLGIGPGQALGLNMPNALGINPQYSFGIPGSDFGPLSFGFGHPWLGMSPQQNVGFGPFGQSLGVGPESNGWGVSGGSAIYNAMFGINPYYSYGIGPQQNVGLEMPNALGINPYYSFGFPGSEFGPFSWGMNPQQNMRIPMLPHFGMNPQQNVGFVNPWMGMNPNAQMPMQAASTQLQPGLQGVQCTINGVGVLTKDADDCERADGEVAKAKAPKQ